MDIDEITEVTKVPSVDLSDSASQVSPKDSDAAKENGREGKSFWVYSYYKRVEDSGVVCKVLEMQT